MVPVGLQHDRLTAALEAIVIGDRSAAYPRDEDRAWQAGLLRTAAACASGESLSAPHWRVHFQSLSSPAVVLNALPYLWVMADAYGHHRGAVQHWAAEMELSAAVACKQLFALLCQQMGAASEPMALPRTGRVEAEADTSPVVQALDLVVQSQGQLAVALGLARHRQWSPAATALVGLVTGLTSGRAGLGAALRQRWLLDYRPAQFDPWRGLEADALTTLAAALHCRWAGMASPPTLPPELGLTG